MCFCYSVPEAVIVQAIQSGFTSLMDIRRETYASSGCAGCTEEVKKLLKKYAGKSPVRQQGSGGANG